MKNKLGNWYALAVTPGREKLARQRVLDRLNTQNVELANLLLICPEEEVVVHKGTNGEREVKKRMSMPGYILMFTRRLDTEAVNVIVGAQGVFEFLGGNEKPQKLPTEQVERLLGSVEESTPGNARDFAYSVGDEIKIISGPMSDFTAEVLEVNPDAGTVHVEIQLFGRPTPTQLTLDQIKPV